MSYATIEEAWGGLGPQPSPSPLPAAEPSHPKRRRLVKPKRKHAKPASRGPSPAVFHGQNPVVFRDGQAFVRGVYSRYGIEGVMELLGTDVVDRLCGRGKTRTRKDGTWSLGGPITFEKVLLGLAVLFCGAVLFEAMSKSGGGNASPPPW